MKPRSAVRIEEKHLALVYRCLSTQRKQDLLLCERLGSWACTRLVQLKAFLLATLHWWLHPSAHMQIKSFRYYLSLLTGSGWFSFQIMALLFWSICCSGVKDRETSAELLSSFGLDWNCRLQLYWEHVSLLPPCGRRRVLLRSELSSTFPPIFINIFIWILN